MKHSITITQVKHVANLANIPITEKEAQELTKAFEETLDVIDNLKECDVAQTQPTHQVTGLENVLREDIVNNEKMFTQEQALSNANQTYQGYFVVPQVLTEKD